MEIDIRGLGEWDGWGLKKRGYIQLSMSRVGCSEGEWRRRPVYPQLERAETDAVYRAKVNAAQERERSAQEC